MADTGKNPVNSSPPAENPRSAMPNRIDEKFSILRAAGQKALIAYISAGDPNLAATRALAIAFEKAGVDILELGVPFSDPLADGVVNQLAAARALASGTTVRGVLDCVREGLIKPQQANELGIIYSVWLDPSIVSVDKIDHAALFNVHREATVKVIRKALAGEPTIEWLLEHQPEVTHYFHELGLAGEL